MTSANENRLKNFKFGMECEMFTLDTKGRMINAAERLIRKVKEMYPSVAIVKEVGKNMIELNSFAHVNVVNVMETVMNDFEKILYVADKEGIVLYPFGTYPGRYTPEISEGAGYKVKEQIFGKKKFLIACRCAGLHLHYTLPWGVFDFKERKVKKLVNSKNKQSMVNAYNLFIAMDPALTTFLQSSPFYQSRPLAKDSRVVVYRGGDALDYPQGLYSKFQTHGMLQPYKVTGTDLLQIIDQRYNEWEQLIRKTDSKAKVYTKHNSILDTTWNPVKINSHGTMEQRGMDMNFPSKIIAVSLLLKYVAKEVQEKFVHILPSDIGVVEPFKREGNVIFIPPHTHLRFELQKKAAYGGLDDDDVLTYCSNLLKLAKSVIPKRRHILLEPLDKMLSKKETTSDMMISDAKDMGIKAKGMTNRQAAVLALKWSRDLYKDIIMTKKALHDLGN